MAGELELTVRGRTYRVSVESLSNERAVVEVDGERLEVDVRRALPAPPAPARALPASPAPAPAVSPVSAGAHILTAVMPGVVTRILVKAGQEVKPGEVLLVLEAMKMENEIRASRAGRVERILVSEGKRVQTGEALLAFA
jgi:glutaconyl-CoA decarboxylase